ncbi:MAG TPA: O-antigen ligase family protein [Dehalococcoidia bacterium]
MTARYLPMSRPPKVSDRTARTVIAVTALLGALVVIYLAASLGLFLYLAALVGATVLGWAVWRWPMQTIILLIFLLPLSRFMSMLSFTFSGSDAILRLSQLWKDLVLVLLVLRMTHESFQRRRAPRLLFLDLLVGAFIVLTLLYTLYPGKIVDSPFMVRLLAFRQDGFYLLAYFVGRAIPIEARHLRYMLWSLIAVSVIMAVVALVQWMMPGQMNALFDKLGYNEFTQAVGTPHEIDLVRTRVLNQGELPRASSLFLADLGLAFFQLLTIPVAAALFFCSKNRPMQFLAGFLLLAMIGTLGLTITRAAIFAAVIALGLMVVFSHSYLRASWSLAGVICMGILFVVVSGFTGAAFADLFSGEEASSLAHMDLIESSSRLIAANPLGLGLGNGSHVSILAGSFTTAALPTWATETWYLQIGLEMGMIAMVLFTVLIVTATVQSLLAYLRTKDAGLRTLALGTAGAGLGFILVAAFHPVWAAVQVAFLFWLFVGVAVRAPEIEKEWQGE